MYNRNPRVIYIAFFKPSKYGRFEQFWHLNLAITELLFYDQGFLFLEFNMLNYPEENSWKLIKPLTTNK